MRDDSAEFSQASSRFIPVKLSPPDWLKGVRKLMRGFLPE